MKVSIELAVSQSYTLTRFLNLYNLIRREAKVRRASLALSLISLLFTSFFFSATSYADVSALTIRLSGFAVGLQPTVTLFVGDNYSYQDEAINGVVTFSHIPTPNCTSNNSDGSVGNIFIEVDPNPTDLTSAFKKIDCTSNPTLATDVVSGSLAIVMGAYVAPTGYWSGTVKAPTGNTLITYARICFAVTGQGDGEQFCTYSDSHGNYAIPKPANWPSSNTFLDASTLSIDASQNSRSNGSAFAQTQYIGPAELIASGFVSEGIAGLALRLSIPNVNLTVDTGTVTTSNAGRRIQVILQSLGGQEIAKLQTPYTDSNGVAHYRLSASQLDHGLLLQADPAYAENQDISSVYAQTTKNYPDESMSAFESGSGDSRVFADTITLLRINMKFVVTDPNTGTVVLPGQNGGAAYWLTTGVNIQPILKGALDPFTENASLAVPKSTDIQPAWVITLFPPGGSGLSIRSYSVVVDSSGVVTSVTDILSGNTLTPNSISGKIPTYFLDLASSNVQGRIYDPVISGQARVLDGNSFIRGDEEGVATNFAQFGKFALNLPNGTYHLQALAGSGSPFANSSMCTVVIALGVIASATPSTAGSCSYSDGKLNFYLTAPNFKITVLNSLGNPLEAAGVYVGLQAWNTDGFTSYLGKTSLFIDTATVSAVNNHIFDSSGPQKLTLRIFPGYGVSDSVAITCQSGDPGTICAGLPLIDLSSSGEAFVMAPFTVRLPAPNTTITVNDPKTHLHVGANAFVDIFKIVDGNRLYISTGVTGLTGKATFYLADTSDSAKYTVQVYPPFFNTTYYVPNTLEGPNHGGYLQSELNTLNPELALPNLQLNVSDSSNGADAYGQVSAEYANALGETTQWISSEGFNRLGKTKLLLPQTTNGDRSKIKLTIDPGPGASGVSKVCFVTVSAAKLVTSIDCGISSGTSLLAIVVRLDSGNYSGNVRHNNKPVGGAVIVAVSGSNVVFGTTGPDGDFSLQLDTSLVWTVNVKPVQGRIDESIGTPSPVTVDFVSDSPISNALISW